MEQTFVSQYPMNQLRLKMYDVCTCLDESQHQTVLQDIKKSS